MTGLWILKHLFACMKYVWMQNSYDYGKIVRIRIWKPFYYGLSSARSFSLALKQSNLGHPPWSHKWKGLVPPRVEASCWLAVLGKISMVHNLQRKGFISDDLQDTCSVCGKETDLVNYRFNHVKTISLSGGISQKCRDLWCFSNSPREVAEAWRMAPFHDCDLVLQKLIPYAILCSIWKERNETVFRSLVLSGHDVLAVVY